jgi:hypothetical protein
MSRPGAAVIAAVVAAVAGVSPVAAEAEAADDDGDDDDDDDAEPRLIVPTGGDDDAPPARKDHDRQLAVGVQIPVGGRVIVPYDGEFCGVRGENENTNAEACVGRTPATLDFAFAYGLRPHLELLVEVRIGIERDFGQTLMSGDGPRLFQWSPGVKFYFSDAGTSKLFSTAQVAFDHTDYGGQPGTDFFLRNLNGLQLDLHPSYGVYFYVGEELAFRRWLWFGVELGIGIQGRYP